MYCIEYNALKLRVVGEETEEEKEQAKNEVEWWWKGKLTQYFLLHIIVPMMHVCVRAKRKQQHTCVCGVYCDVLFWFQHSKLFVLLSNLL